MKITILPADDGEEEIIIKCNALTKEMLKALEQFRGGIDQLALYKENKIRLMDVSEFITLNQSTIPFLPIAKMRFTRRKAACTSWKKNCP